MKVYLYKLIEECVERGIIGSIDNEDLSSNEDYLVERFTERVMSELCEYINFNGDV